MSALGVMRALALALVLMHSPVQSQEPPRAAELSRLRELFELGLTAEVAREGSAAIATGGVLAGDAEAVALVARALFATGREAEAFSMLDTALDTARASAPATDRAARAALELARARLLLERDDLSGALALLAEAPASPTGTQEARTAGYKPRYPDAPDNLLLLGRVLARSGRLDLAEAPLAHLIELAPLHPELPSAWHMLFDAAIERGDLERARACRAERERLERWHALFRARSLQVRRDPDARLPRLGLALLWIEARELERAEEALRELLARHPTDAEAWLHLGEVHRLAQRYDDAETAYERALEHDPGEQRARYNLALLHRARGRAEDARRELEALLATKAESDPAFLGAHLELARLLDQAGDRNAAEKRYARYRELGGTAALAGDEGG